MVWMRFIYFLLYLLSGSYASLGAQETSGSMLDNDIYAPSIRHIPEKELSLVGNSLEVRATITDNKVVSEVFLLYRFYNASRNTAYLLIQMRAMGNGLYSGILPVEGDNPVVEYYIKATDREGNTTLHGNMELPLKVTTALLRPKEPEAIVAPSLVPIVVPFNLVNSVENKELGKPSVWKSLHKKWWFWAILGGMAAGVSINNIDKPQPVIQ